VYNNACAPGKREKHSVFYACCTFFRRRRPTNK
jgi:hypothetical protein